MVAHDEPSFLEGESHPPDITFLASGNFGMPNPIYNSTSEEVDVDADQNNAEEKHNDGANETEGGPVNEETGF